MRELCNAFVRRRGPRPTAPQMMQTYRIISQHKAAIMASAGSSSLFEARVFADLYFATRADLLPVPQKASSRYSPRSYHYEMAVLPQTAI